MALKVGIRCGSWDQRPPPGARPHQAEHTHRHQTAVFRSGETCPEAGSKCDLPSDILGPSPQGPAPSEQRESTRSDPSTQHKRDGVPPRNETTAVATGLLGHSGPSGSGDRPGRKSRRTLRRPREEHALDDRCQQGTPPTDDFGGPSGKRVPSATAEARPFL